MEIENDKNKAIQGTASDPNIGRGLLEPILYLPDPYETILLYNVRRARMTKTNQKLPTVFDATTAIDQCVEKSIKNHSELLSLLFHRLTILEMKVANSGCKCDKSDRVELKVQNDSTPDDIATLIEKAVNYGENTETKVVARDPICAPGCGSDGIPSFRFEEKDDGDKKSSVKYEGADPASYDELYHCVQIASNGTTSVKVRGCHHANLPLVNLIDRCRSTFQLRELMNCGNSTITLDAVGCIKYVCANIARCVREVLKTRLSEVMLNTRDTICINTDMHLRLDAINGNLIAAQVIARAYTVSEDASSTRIPIANDLDFVFGMEGQKMVAYREYGNSDARYVQKISNFDIRN